MLLYLLEYFDLDRLAALIPLTPYYLGVLVPLFRHQ